MRRLGDRLRGHDGKSSCLLAQGATRYKIGVGLRAGLRDCEGSRGFEISLGYIEESKFSRRRWAKRFIGGNLVNDLSDGSQSVVVERA